MRACATVLAIARDSCVDQTDVERALWSRLRDRRLTGRKFVRQFPIGPFIVDFVCREAGLIVELDGGQHSETTAADARRTAFLEFQGYRVVRFWNNDVISNMEGVLTEMLRCLES